MKKFLLAVACMISCTSIADAQLLWKISGNGLTSGSYIFGTYHLAPLSIKDSISGLRDAFDKTEQVYGEIIMEDMMKPEISEIMQQKIMLPDSTTLSDFYTEEQYNLIDSVFRSYTGMKLEMFGRMKPSFITQQLTVMILLRELKDFNPQEQLDTWFQTEAKKAGKYVGALESAEYQCDVLFDSQSLERQAELLYCTVTNIDDLLESDMTEAYMNQNLGRLYELITEKNSDSCDSTPEEDDMMIYGRNRDWAGKMPGIMKEKPTFFVVGAGHLPGDKGVLKLLESQGYIIEPVL